MVSAQDTVKYINCEDLEAKISANSVYLLDCSVAEKEPSARSEYEKSHIKGAHFFDLENCRDKTSPYPHMFPKQDNYIEHMKNLGVGLDKPIVVYDNTKGDWASRGAFVIHTYGHPQVSILNGGFKKWNTEARPVESGTIGPQDSATDFNFTLNSERLKEFDEIHKIATGELPAVQIVDARFSKLY